MKKHAEEGNPGGKGNEAYKVIAAGDMAGDLPKDMLGLSSNTSTKSTSTAVTATVGPIAVRSSPREGILPIIEQYGALLNESNSPTVGDTYLRQT